MKKIIAVCVLVVIVIVGCQHSPKHGPRQPVTSREEQDKRVTVEISQEKETNKFQVTAKYQGKLDMTWWIFADADLFDIKGKIVPRPKGKTGTSWFHWVEDNDSADSHFGYYRNSYSLEEHLVLDTKGLASGKYRVVPSVNIFERGRDANPKMSDPYYRDIHGIRPGKVKDLVFTIK